MALIKKVNGMAQSLVKIYFLQDNATVVGDVEMGKKIALFGLMQ